MRIHHRCEPNTRTLKEININEAPKIIKSGAIVLSFLQDSISLICDARNDDAVEILREAKNRKSDKGFTILIDSDARLNRYVTDVPALAWDIIDTSDSPIILVLPGGKNMSKKALASDKSIAVRMVTQPDEQKLVQATNGPVACTALLRPDGTLAQGIEEADPTLLEKVDYVLSLPTSKSAYSQKKIPIISLDAESNVRIIRE